ncbi:MAG: hypothetical protein ACKOPT_15055, partial [Cyanobium sp.]
HYMNAKKTSLFSYYKYVVTHSLRHVAIIEYGLNFKEKNLTPLSMCGKLIKKIFYYSYILLLEIPISAKIKHAKEEMLFRSNPR